VGIKVPAAHRDMDDAPLFTHLPSWCPRKCRRKL